MAREFFYQWANRGETLFNSNRIDEGIAFVKMQTRESRRLLGEEYAVVGDAKRFFNFFTTSISSLYLEINDFAEEPFGFNLPHSDGSVLYLPSRIDYFSRNSDNERIYSALTAIIAAYFGYGTLQFELAHFFFRSSLAELYGTSLAPVNQTLETHYLKLKGKISETSAGDT